MQKDLIRTSSAKSSGKLLEISQKCWDREKGIFKALWKMTGLVYGPRDGEDERNQA